MTAPTTNPYIWSTSASVALCIAAPLTVYAASQRSLKKYICRTQQAGNNTDSRIIPDLPPPEVEPEAPARQQSTRSKWANGLKITAFVAAMMSVGLGIGIGLPMLATPKLLDVFWLFFVTYQTGTLVRSAINTALPDPRVMNVHWTSWNSVTWTTTGPNPETLVPNTKARLAVTAALTALCISGVYTGTTWLMCIPVCAFLYDQVSCLAIPDRKIKNLLKWVVYLQAGLAGILLAVMGISALHKRYTSSDSDSDDTKPSKFSQPSPEILALMIMFQKAIPLIAPGIFVAIGLRFDYAQASKTKELVPSTGVAVNSHDISVPSFPRPIFTAAMKVYFLQLALFGLAYSSPLPAYIKGGLPMVEALCMPVWPVVARQVLVARRLGIYQEFMDYFEPRVRKDSPTIEGPKEKEDIPEDIEKAAPSAADSDKA